MDLIFSTFLFFLTLSMFMHNSPHPLLGFHVPFRIKPFFVPQPINKLAESLRPSSVGFNNLTLKRPLKIPEYRIQLVLILSYFRIQSKPFPMHQLLRCMLLHRFFPNQNTTAKRSIQQKLQPSLPASSKNTSSHGSLTSVLF